MGLTVLFMVQVSILGLQVFGGKYSEELERALAIRYIDLYWAMIASFQYITLDGWADAMQLTYTEFGSAAVTFFVFVITVARFVIMVDFIAIILNQFDQQTVLKQEMHEMERDSRI